MGQTVEMARLKATSAAPKPGNRPSRERLSGTSLSGPENKRFRPNDDARISSTAATQSRPLRSGYLHAADHGVRPCQAQVGMTDFRNEACNFSRRAVSFLWNGIESLAGQMPEI
jgi:hypothetical protein